MNGNFVKMSDTHNYNTRSSEFNFYTRSVNCYSSNTFHYNAIKDWNSVPRELKMLLA